MKDLHLRDLDRRRGKHAMQDGLFEVLLGVMLLVPGGLFLTVRRIPARWDPDKLSTMLAPLLWGAIVLGIGKAILTARSRLVAPRSGYVSERPARNRAWILLGCVLLCGWLPLWLRQQMPALDWIGLSLAAIEAGAFLYMGVQFGLPHMIGMGVFAAAVAVWDWSAAPDPERGLWAMIVLGGVVALAGIWRFTLFLGTTAEQHEVTT